MNELYQRRPGYKDKNFALKSFFADDALQLSNSKEEVKENLRAKSLALK